MRMRIKDIVEKYHTTRKALLVYENKGFIHPKRDESGYRVYNQKDLEMIKKILLLRKLEFSLEEIEDILFHQNLELIYEKKKEYDKQKHFIETKGDYLDYIYKVLKGEYDIDEAIDAVDETLKLYASNQYDDRIHFEYHRDTIGVVWLGSLFIAFLSQQSYLIILSLLLGVLSIILSLQSVRKWITSISKNLIAVIGFILGLFLWIVYISYPDNFQNCMIGTLGLDMAVVSVTFFKPIKNFFLKFTKYISFVLFLCGIVMLIWICCGNIDGVLGMSLTQLAFLLIVIGIIYNPFIRHFIFAIFNLY